MIQIRLFLLLAFVSTSSCGADPPPPSSTPLESVATGNTVLTHLRGARPIPVGHRLEVRIFYSVDGQAQRDSPLVTDLETGVVYGSLEHFHPPVALYSPGQLFPTSEAVLPGLREHSRWYGKVVVCNVVFTGLKGNESQTTLVLERIAPPAPAPREEIHPRL